MLSMSPASRVVVVASVSDVPARAMIAATMMSLMISP
jgi:hypothetical protein